MPTTALRQRQMFSADRGDPLSRALSALSTAKEVEHFGLRWDRFCPEQKTASDDQRTREEFQKNRIAFFDSFAKPHDGLRLYQTFFDAWRQLLESRGAVTKKWRAVDRVCFGAGDESVLEVGIRFHHTYGVPVIAGSAQKGLVRRAALAFGCDEDSFVSPMLGTPGDTGAAAAITFHDALWIPSGPSDSPFVRDTMTVHHPDYYQGGAPPADWDSPTPLTTLAAQGMFLFAIEGEAATAAFAMRLLGTALRHHGVGARTLKGYGRFDIPAADMVPMTMAYSPLHGSLAPAPERTQVREQLPLDQTQHAVDRAMLSYQPNTGRFEVAFSHGGRPVKVLTTPAPIELVGGDTPDGRAMLEVLRARCRKKGAIPVRATYQVKGTQFRVVRIDVQ